MSYEIDDPSQTLDVSDQPVSLSKAVALAKEISKQVGGFITFEDEGEEIVQFAIFPDRILIDAPLNDGEVSLQAELPKEEFMQVIDELSDPVAGFIDSLDPDRIRNEPITAKPRSEEQTPSESYGKEELDELVSELLAEEAGMTWEERFECLKGRNKHFLSDRRQAHGEDMTPELLAYEEYVHEIEDSLQDVRKQMSTAKRVHDDEAELAARKEYFSALMNLKPLKRYGVGRFEADYTVNRISILLMRLKRPKEAVATINEYNASLFQEICAKRRKRRDEEIQKRLERAVQIIEKQPR